MMDLLEKLSDKLVRAKLCWLRHDWTKWEIFNVTIVGGKTEYEVTHQKRTCLKCNIEKWRRPSE